MSTRSVIEFSDKYSKEPVRVYKHTDGYPYDVHGNMHVLRSFFDTVSAQTNDTRFDDSSYLAAKLIVFLARGYAHRYEYDPTTGKSGYVPSQPLDFRGVGIVNQIPGDVEYVYTVHCGEYGKNGYPLVSIHDTFQGEDNESRVDLGQVEPNEFWSGVFNEGG